jgi:hypothetical protein
MYFCGSGKSEEGQTGERKGKRGPYPHDRQGFVYSVNAIWILTDPACRELPPPCWEVLFRPVLGKIKIDRGDGAL